MEFRNQDKEIKIKVQGLGFRIEEGALTSLATAVVAHFLVERLVSGFEFWV